MKKATRIMKKLNVFICVLLAALLFGTGMMSKVYAADYPSAYAPLLLEIRDGIENKGFGIGEYRNRAQLTRIQESEMSEPAKAFFISLTAYSNLDISTRLCYSVRDLDNDGSPELLLSFDCLDSSYLGKATTYAIFTLANGTPTLVKCFSPRNLGAIYGSIIYDYTIGGAFTHTSHYCRLNGRTLEVVDGYVHEKDEFYSIKQTLISETQANAIDAKYQKQTAPSWHALIPGLFADVDYSSWYSEPVIWATEKEITTGTSEITFSPDANCTRGQMVTFLWRAKGCPNPQITTSKFSDVSADAYYFKAVQWALENGVTQGTTDSTFSPDAIVTRAQTVTFLWRLSGSPTFSTKNPFNDVAVGSYFYNAVLWAVKGEITKGTSDTAFSPNAPCTRAQIVTFLYRVFCPERFHLEVTNYFKNPERLQSALSMEKTDPWNLGGTSYKYDGFYVETRDRAFSMKNEGNHDITLYGVTLGSSKQNFTEALYRNGWLPMGETQNNWTDFGTVIDGGAYYLQLTEDDSGAIVMWYVNNWPQGDYRDFYSQFN